MDLNITGRTAIVTGASSGIGLGVATELAAHGVRLVMVARNAEKLEAAAADLAKRFSVETLPVAGDVSAPAFPAQAVRRATERFGAADMLVNDAGRAHSGTVFTTSEEDWDSMTAVKLSALRRFCREAIPGMRERGWGRVVNISSIGGIYPNPPLTVSHALSAAINNLTRSLALEVAPSNVLVNAVAVGAIATANWAANMLPDVRRRRPELAGKTDEEVMTILGKEKTPVGRFGTPEDIGAIAAFLLSDRNRFVTGHTVEASGGAERFL